MLPETREYMKIPNCHANKIGLSKESHPSRRGFLKITLTVPGGVSVPHKTEYISE